LTATAWLDTRDNVSREGRREGRRGEIEGRREGRRGEIEGRREGGREGGRERSSQRLDTGH
jgi:hypothetical protein